MHSTTSISRRLRSVTHNVEYLCSQCAKLSTSTALQSGHNRWSKIKHDKGAADMKKNIQRSQFSKDIYLASKLGGGDVNGNPQLATLVTAARKAGFPKPSIEAAIARGQGKSTTGAALEAFTMECIMPPQIAMIIEAETDNRARTLADLRLMIKVHGGTATPTTYLFQKKGRIAFEKSENGLGTDEILDDAIEAGAEDVEADEDGGIVVWTKPSMAYSAAEALSKSHGLKVASTDIIWDPNQDTQVEIPEGNLESLSAFLDELQDNPTVQGIYANVTQGSLREDLYNSLREKLDA